MLSDEPTYVTVDDYEPVARARLPDHVYGFIAGGAGDERTVTENRRAFDRWVVRPRFLRGAGNPDLSTSVLGTSLAFPVLVAPWAYQRMAHEDGEIATARAAADAGTVMVVSSTAADRLEQIAAASTGPKWWQLYIATDRGLTGDILARVVAAGYGAVCWTVDFVVPGLRHRDTRSGFVLPIVADTEYVLDPLLTWDDVGWIRDHAPGLPLLIKGILTAEDAELAVQAGVDGIVVSNHGGRQLDAAVAALDALPEVAETVAGRVPILIDGGVRRGLDVLKALALGASAVMVGRAAAWGLAAAGRAGVEGVLRILREELENTMANSGCRTMADIARPLVAPAPVA